MAGRTTQHVEAPIARVLDARLERRKVGTAFTPPSLAEVGERLARLLHAELGPDVRILDLRPLTGGASKQHFVFDLEEKNSDGSTLRRPLVLRAVLSECLVTTDLAREIEAVRGLQGVIPVPEVVAADASGRAFGSPAVVFSLVPGTTVPPEVAGKPSGFGACYSPARRRVLGPAFVECLAKLHRFADSPAAHDLPAFERPRAGTTESADWVVAWWRRVWDDDTLEDHPMIEVAFDWLEEHAPVADHIALIHGDYRTGNFLFDPETNDLTAILDWEMVHFGDRHEDLGWTLARIYAAKDDDGTELTCGLLPRDELLRRYAEASGLPVDPERLFFYEVFNELKIAVIALGSGPRNALDGRSLAHLTNVIFSPAGYRCLARLQELLA
jgi:aminoglycoside phosphotransferase (APT) family kinase protein